HRARGARVERVVLADAHARARLEFRAALAHDDLAAGDGLPRERLHAKALGVGVAPVAARAKALLMSHRRAPLSLSRPPSPRVCLSRPVSLSPPACLSPRPSLLRRASRPRAASPRSRLSLSPGPG